MEIEKKILSKLNMVYSVASIKINEKIHFLAATEDRGECLLFSPPDWKVSKVWDRPGGTMTILPLKGENDVFLAIQEFFPVFKAKNAGIVYAKLIDKDKMSWEIKNIISLPYVHRIEEVKISDLSFIVASTLCSGKDFEEDWSKPGAVYTGPVPEDSNDTWHMEPVFEGIKKNHGMHLTTLDGQNVLLISGKEGVFLLKIPRVYKNKWEAEQLIDNEVSDVFVNDIDNDGKPEIITIEPFHGDDLKIYKFKNNKWKAIFRKQINCGHVIWSGKILKKESIIIGNRAGNKDLILLQPGDPNLKDIDCTVIDKDIGPTQIAIVHRENYDIVLSSNHGAGEIALYILS